MADVSQVTLDGGFVPVKATRKKNPIALGWYPTHVVDCTIATKGVKNKYRAKIYNLKVAVAPEAKNQKFNIKDIAGNEVEVTGEDQIDYEFRGMGVFYFLNPQPGDDFEANPKGNVGYMYLCEALGFDLKEAEVNGEKVIKLPEISKDDIVGLPVMSCIGESRPWIGKDGNSRTSLEVKAFKVWKDAKKKDVLGDIPF